MTIHGDSSYVYEDGDGGSDVITVTITVTDVSERPSRPAAPTVEMVEDDPETDADESTTSLKVSWVAPETTGPPITNYDHGVPRGHVTAPSQTITAASTVDDNCQDIIGTETTITDLAPQLVLPGPGDGEQCDEQNSLPSPTRDREH